MTNANTSANANVHASSDLFKPMQLGAVQLQNRIVMAPLTRSRAQAGDVPTPLAAEYYAQRASAGLIVTEGTQISQEGQGYPATPGIFSPEQIAGWKHVTEAVHAAGGRIFAQLWHVGRISHPALQPDGMLPVAPSAIRPAGQAFIEDPQGEGEGYDSYLCVAQSPPPTKREINLKRPLCERRLERVETSFRSSRNAVTVGDVHPGRQQQIGQPQRHADQHLLDVA